MTSTGASPRTSTESPSPGSDGGDARADDLARPRLRWWFEIGFVATFYVIYTGIRNQFGSAAVDPQKALDNAELIIDIERAIGSFQELRIQEWFIEWTLFIQFWNIFYGTFHFGVTIFTMVWLYRRFPERYSQWRTTLAATTGLALTGFALFPLMPPRLLPDDGPFGGNRPEYPFVDTLADPGGLWSFDSGTMQELSNQYAAMPSLHFGWSTWCLLALYPVLRTRAARWTMVAYPILTLFAIVVTANHYWIDAIGGLIVLAVGYWLATWLLRLAREWRVAQRTKQLARATTVNAAPRDAENTG